MSRLFWPDHAHKNDIQRAFIARIVAAVKRVRQNSLFDRLRMKFGETFDIHLIEFAISACDNCGQLSVCKMSNGPTQSREQRSLHLFRGFHSLRHCAQQLWRLARWQGTAAPDEEWSHSVTIDPCRKRSH